MAEELLNSDNVNVYRSVVAAMGSNRMGKAYGRRRQENTRAINATEHIAPRSQARATYSAYAHTPVRVLGGSEAARIAQLSKNLKTRTQNQTPRGTNPICTLIEAYHTLPEGKEWSHEAVNQAKSGATNIDNVRLLTLEYSKRLFLRRYGFFRESSVQGSCTDALIQGAIQSVV